MAAALAWTDLASGDTSGVAVSGSGFDAHSINASYPALRCLTDDPSDVTRVDYDVGASAATSTLTSDWASASSAQLVAALNCRLPASVTAVNARLVSTGGSTLATGTSFAAATWVPIAGETDRYNLYWLMSAAQSAGKVALDVSISAAAVDYYEVGKLWASAALVFDNGVDSAWSLGVVDPSIVTRTNGGGLSAHRYPRRSTLSIPLTARAYEQVLGNSAAPTALCLRQMAMEAGMSAPVIAVVRSSDQHATQVSSLYGSITQLPDFGHQGGNYFASTMQLEQIR